MKTDISYTRVRDLDELNAFSPGEELGFLLGGDYQVNLSGKVKQIVDLQNLDLAGVPVPEGKTLIPAMVSLQKALNALAQFPELEKAASLEGGPNLRNSLSIGNYLRHGAADGPLRVCLSALGSEARYLGEAEPLGPTEFAALDQERLPLYLLFPDGGQLSFESVGRSPKDKPTVCLAVYSQNNKEIRVAISHPIDGVRLFDNKDGVAGPESQLESALSDSGDAWASAAYRQAAVAVLLKRALARLGSAGAGGER